MESDILSAMRSEKLHTCKLKSIDGKLTVKRVSMENEKVKSFVIKICRMGSESPGLFHILYFWFVGTTSYILNETRLTDFSIFTDVRIYYAF